MAAADKREITEQLNSSHGSYELVVSPVVLGPPGCVDRLQLDSGPWFAVGLAVFGVVGAVVKVYLDYRLRMAAVDAASRSARDVREAERAVARAAEAVVRAEREAALAAELAAAEAQSVLTARSQYARERVS